MRRRKQGRPRIKLRDQVQKDLSVLGMNNWRLFFIFSLAIKRWSFCLYCVPVRIVKGLFNSNSLSFYSERISLCLRSGLNVTWLQTFLNALNSFCSMGHRLAQLFSSLTDPVAISQKRSHANNQLKSYENINIRK